MIRGSHIFRAALRFLNGVAYALVFLLTSALLFPVSADDKITVYTEEWAPYNYLDGNHITGFSIEIVRHLIKETGTDATIEVLPSMRATKSLLRNPRAMFVSMFRTKEREKQYNWIGPLIDSAIYFYKRKDNPIEIETLKDAREVPSIASRHAGLVYRILKARGFNNLDATAIDGRGVYLKLLAGRSALAISDAPLGVKHLLKSLGVPPDAITQTPVKILDMQLYIAVNKNIPLQTVMRWQKALDEMKADGVYEQILGRYGS